MTGFQPVGSSAVKPVRGARSKTAGRAVSTGDAEGLGLADALELDVEAAVSGSVLLPLLHAERLVATPIDMSVTMMVRRRILPPANKQSANDASLLSIVLADGRDLAGQCRPLAVLDAPRRRDPLHGSRVQDEEARRCRDALDASDVGAAIVPTRRLETPTRRPHFAFFPRFLVIGGGSAPTDSALSARARLPRPPELHMATRGITN